MKLTNQQLKQIIQEELENVLEDLSGSENEMRLAQGHLATIGNSIRKAINRWDEFTSEAYRDDLQMIIDDIMMEFKKGNLNYLERRDSTLLQRLSNVASMPAAQRGSRANEELRRYLSAIYSGMDSVATGDNR
jgi:hypothetical protein